MSIFWRSRKPHTSPNSVSCSSFGRGMVEFSLFLISGFDCPWDAQDAENKCIQSLKEEKIKLLFPFFFSFLLRALFPVPSAPPRGQPFPVSSHGRPPAIDRLMKSWFKDAASWSSALDHLVTSVDCLWDWLIVPASFPVNWLFLCLFPIGDFTPFSRGLLFISALPPTILSPSSPLVVWV